MEEQKNDSKKKDLDRNQNRQKSFLNLYQRSNSESKKVKRKLPKKNQFSCQNLVRNEYGSMIPVQP
jgi:hypothetical protein